VKPDAKVLSCPSCGTDAILSGTKIKSTEPVLDGDWLWWEDIYLPIEFRCFCCGLHLEGHALLQGADLGGQFTVTQGADPSTYFSAMEEYFEEYNNM
jgi:hypothetical protein